MIKADGGVGEYGNKMMQRALPKLGGFHECIWRKLEGATVEGHGVQSLHVMVWWISWTNQRFILSWVHQKDTGLDGYCIIELQIIDWIGFVRGLSEGFFYFKTYLYMYDMLGLILNTGTISS